LLAIGTSGLLEVAIEEVLVELDPHAASSHPAPDSAAALPAVRWIIALLVKPAA
jgi:hypothetical protein